MAKTKRAKKSGGDGAKRLADKAAGTVKTNLRSSYGYTDPETGQRRFYGPGEAEVPGNLARALGIDAESGMTQAQARKAAQSDRQTRTAKTTRTAKASRAANAATTGSDTTDAADTGSDAADTANADTANSNTADSGDGS